MHLMHSIFEPRLETCSSIWSNDMEIDARWEMKINIQIFVFYKIAILIKSKMLILVI